MSLPVVLLAGGLGTRLREETETRPKPMVEVGGFPILWHIMKTYASFGYNEFVICLGYKGGYIKDFFLNYSARQGNLTIDTDTGLVEVHRETDRDAWRVHLLDTGLSTMTGGRLRRAAQYLGNRPFMATYGDGLADINLHDLVSFHRRCGKSATITAVRPPARFGGLSVEGDMVLEFIEKPQIGEGWINGGFMVLEPEIVDRIKEDATVFEREPLETLAADGELAAFRHEGFWQCMDTARDVTYLRELWDLGAPPWKRWA